MQCDVEVEYTLPDIRIRKRKQMDGGETTDEPIRDSLKRFDELLSKVGPLITYKNTTYRKSIPPAEQLALTLRFLAHGGEQQICALNYRIGVSTTHIIVKRVCDAIWTVLSSEYLKRTEAEFIEISEKFNMYSNFPQCLGAIDGKHVVIQQPKHSGTIYHNYKGTNSIILMAACDAEYRFTIVDIGAPSICSDEGVFNNSIFGKLIEQNKVDFPADEKLAVVIKDQSFQKIFQFFALVQSACIGLSGILLKILKTLSKNVH
ncbi:protein ANTAGONIST OF LIKE HETEROCHROMATIN PROTEIN 1-like [Centruroides sculpturatus]|uniref:protein ANTAGONIST OF LIKE HETEROCHROMATIN PROTEIN 1-like n=1 Tax=Centruroides sculpturatus TaxID=218467 RepID=UPI000C6EE012|nr:protein ANTAGONIST OF LIKE HETEROCHROMATIN PROTEIN 1-like [Centruroides sculpturatus]